MSQTLVCQQQLYSRAYSVAFGDPKTQNFVTRYGNLNLEDQKMSAIRVSFEITKAAKGAANTGNVVLYNINQTHRSSLKRGDRVFLSAGYQGLVRPLITGDVLTATHKRDGPNISTTLELVDSLIATTYAKIDKTYPPDTPLYSILQDIAKVMTDTGTVKVGQVFGIPDVKFGRGYTAHGACKDVLEELLHPIGMEAFVDNAQLNIMPRRSGILGNVLKLSARTGLLGIPSVSYEHISFESLLDPRLVPGQLVTLDTNNVAINGNYKIRSCVMSGDSHDTKWSVACKGVRISEKLLGVRYKTAPADNFSLAQIAFDPTSDAPIQNQSKKSFLDAL